MKDDIGKKLSKLIESPVDEECKVVYLMVEIRKIIEHKRKELEEKTGHRYYPNLTFYCDWCVHVELSGSAARYYLKHIAALTNQDSGINDKIFEFLSFKKFKKELNDFFEEYGLDSALFFQNWEMFLKVFIEVLADCPLLISDPMPGQIKSFHFMKRLGNGGRRVLCDIDFEKEIGGGHYSALVGIY
jgi:hypothetical protein